MHTKTHNGSDKLYRREFLGNGTLGGLSLALGGWFPVCATGQTAGDRTAQALAELKGSSLPRKVELVQEVYEHHAFSPSGIMYSMMWMDENGIRPFRSGDFTGKFVKDENVGNLKLDGPWDYLHGENSITSSGLYLAAQTYRYEVTQSPAALEQARRAFHSLDLIYRLGEAAGKPGWMGKPYAFRYSVQTSGDQYLDASWGLWNFHRIASDEERRRIGQMFVGFADYWRSVDYVLDYFGGRWDQKGETGAYNAIYAMINACAYSFSKSPVHLAEFEKWMARATWPTINAIEAQRSKIKSYIDADSEPPVVQYGKPFPMAKDLLKPGEFLCWETVIHNKFVAVAADLILQSKTSDLSGKACEIMGLWWREWKYGTGDDFLCNYWFAVDLVKDTWRPLPATKPWPKERWFFGDPFFANISDVRWNEPLARFMITSVLGAEHCPARRQEMQSVARRMMDSMDAAHLKWIVDPDGKQLLPEISYYGHCLSSEVPASFLATYWKGRKDKLW